MFKLSYYNGNHFKLSLNHAMGNILFYSNLFDVCKIHDGYINKASFVLISSVHLVCFRSSQECDFHLPRNGTTAPSTRISAHKRQITKE